MQLKGRFTLKDFVACDKLTTGLLHKTYTPTTVVYVTKNVVGFAATIVADKFPLGRKSINREIKKTATATGTLLNKLMSNTLAVHVPCKTSTCCMCGERKSRRIILKFIFRILCFVLHTVSRTK